MTAMEIDVNVGEGIMFIEGHTSCDQQNMFWDAKVRDMCTV